MNDGLLGSLSDEQSIFNATNGEILHAVDSSPNDELSDIDKDRLIERKRTLFRNFLIFSITFSVSHGTVDGVLAFATAELGSRYGSYGTIIISITIIRILSIILFFLKIKLS
jgi:hypothetical protein